MASKVRRTDTTKEIAQAEAQAALWQRKADDYLAKGRPEKAAAPLLRVQFYMNRADRIRPKMEAAE